MPINSKARCSAVNIVSSILLKTINMHNRFSVLEHLWRPPMSWEKKNPGKSIQLVGFCTKQCTVLKSRIRETLTLLTCADSSTVSKI